ncbi:MAG: tape measure protein, partial [Tannerellaceae bacterium]|nr:tape measure protein [Tannerellaceae bacterium]
MATLYFKVSADVDKVIQMRQEVEKLKAVIGGMDVNKQGKDVSALMARIRELEGSLAGTARAAAQAGTILEQNFKKRVYDSSVAVNNFTQKIIEQKSVVHETEAKVRRLADAYYKSTGVAFGVQQIKDFASAVINTRAEMQMLQAAFQTLLGSKDKADAMFSELKQFAVESPLSMGDVAKSAQTLLGFNVAVEKVIPTIKAIGDISMGDSQKFNSLTLAFAQMSAAGKLMGQDLNQMINAGFNPLQQMSAKTGKSISELKEAMSKGAISAQMVSDAFMQATQAGGKFFGMTKEGAKTIQGAQAQLEGAIQDMLNEMGQSTEGFVKDAYGAAQGLVENWKEVGKA